jgi:hypothetical protein
MGLFSWHHLVYFWGFMVKSYVLANPDWICEGRFCLSSVSGYVQRGSTIVIEIGKGGSSSGV